MQWHRVPIVTAASDTASKPINKNIPVIGRTDGSGTEDATGTGEDEDGTGNENEVAGQDLSDAGDMDDLLDRANGDLGEGFPSPLRRNTG
jgi:ABC-type phosphate transport system substrate-binding protein